MGRGAEEVLDRLLVLQAERFGNELLSEEGDRIGLRATGWQ